MFLLGFVLGIAVVAVGALLLANASSASTTSGGRDAVSWVKLALGVLLLAGAMRQYRSRLRSGSEPAMPKWMAGIDSFTTGRALALGAALSASGMRKNELGRDEASEADIPRERGPLGFRIVMRFSRRGSSASAGRIPRR